MKKRRYGLEIRTGTNVVTRWFNTRCARDAARKSTTHPTIAVDEENLPHFTLIRRYEPDTAAMLEGLTTYLKAKGEQHE